MGGLTESPGEELVLDGPDAASYVEQCPVLHAFLHQGVEKELGRPGGALPAEASEFTAGPFGR